VTKTFSGATAVSDAQAYFQDNAINLGAAPQVANLSVDVNFSMTGDAVGAGFGEDFLIGATNGEPAPLITVPGGPQLGQQNQATGISGVSVAETDPLSAGQTITVLLTDNHGGLSVGTSGSDSVSGAGSTHLTVTGSVSDVNASLATLTDNDGTLTTDTVT